MMADLPTNVRLTWQLVSQFVSWEFCRYMSENTDSETDVLAFLRNMIVQRTEKSIAEVTKHEIIAKFIMEIKAIDKFQVSHIIRLSDSVKEICPELNVAVSNLVHHLVPFFEDVQSMDESHKALEEAIGIFSKEASRLLPQPDLLLVVAGSLSDVHHHHNHPHPETLKKSIYNAALFEKVLECLHFEGMTQSEARIIAVALKEEKDFVKIMQCAEAEPETEADSEHYTLSQQSEPVYSQEFIKNTQALQSVMNPLSHDVRDIQAHTQVPANTFLPSSQQSPEMPYLQQNEDPPDVLCETPPSPVLSSQDYPFIHSNNFNQNGNAQLEKLSSNMLFAQSSANESDEGDAELHDRLQAKFKQIYESQLRQSQSDSDTSDCDKNPLFKILTPTYFKQGQNKTIYVSDVESNDSSILSNVPGSQQADPNWSKRQSFIPASEYVRPNKRKKRPGEKNKPFKRDGLRRKPVIQIDSSSDSDENNVVNRTSNSPFRSPQHPAMSATRTRAELGPLNRRKIAKTLYRSPTLCIDDFVSVLRKPNSETTLSEVSVPNVTKPKKAKKNPSPFGTIKKQKCKQCNRMYKTAVALRRHIFLKHTEPPEDSDCET